MKKSLLSIKNLSVSIQGKRILHSVSLDVGAGETHIIMGPNGSGKSTLLSTIMGDPRCTVTRGSVHLNGKSIASLSPTERARGGIFLAFQNPPAIPGLGFGSFLRQAVCARVPEAAARESIADFARRVRPLLPRTGLDESFFGRSLNEGFSGGEKKKAEIVQLLTLAPAIAFLDEIDSGLDVDGIRLCMKAVRDLQKKRGTALVLVTHNPALLRAITPDRVHVFSKGAIIASGTAQLAREIQKRGYEKMLS